MNRPVATFLILAAIVPAGCSEVVLTDRSADPRYAPLIGTRYEIVGNLAAYGIRDHSNAPVEYVTLVTAPGFAGPEVAFHRWIRPGSRFEILQVLETNVVFDCDIVFAVRLEDAPVPLPPGIPVHLDVNRGNEAGGCEPRLNPAVYRSLP